MDNKFNDLYCMLSESALKSIAQDLRNSYEWYGKSHYKTMERDVVEFINQVFDEKFETTLPHVS